MQILDPTSQVLSLVGLLLQTGAVWVYAVLFMAVFLSTEAELRRPRCAVAFAVLGLGLSALALHYLFDNSEWGASFLLAYPWLVGGSHLLYLLAKLVYAPLILEEALSLTRGRIPRSVSLIVWSSAAASFLFALLDSASLGRVVVVQAPLMTLCFGATAWLFWSARREAAGVGAGIAAAGALGTALIWPLWAFSQAFVNSTGGHAWRTYSGFSSFIDMALLAPLAIGILVVLVDRTHRKSEQVEAERGRLESEVADLQRVKSLGLLVSGVAHELNNPLTAILGFAEDLESRLKGPEARAAQVVREQAERCRGIVHRLGVLSGVREPVRVRIDLSELIQRVVRGLEPMVRQARLRLKLDLHRPIDLTSVDAVRIEQLVVNLIVNALQASPPGATVTISSRVDGQVVVFRVEDRGPGVPEALREKITEPFFTTRRESGGKGLGLALVHETLRRCGGELVVQDREDGLRGACFMARFPIDPEVSGVEAPAASGSEEKAADQQAGHEVILLPMATASRVSGASSQRP